MISDNNNACQQQQKHETNNNDTNPYDYEVQIMSIVGPPAEKMINCLKMGQAFFFKDKSVEGVPILEVWAEVDEGFWWD